VISTAPVPSALPVQQLLDRVHRDCAPLTDGRVADYIPELAKANPEFFGLCVATASGAVYEVGDTRQEFTIQSISKPLVYGLALEDNGREAVRAKVGVEPTGDAFNSISLEPGTGRPRNPMINAGAIAIAGLVAGKSPHARFRRVLAAVGAYAGRELTCDDRVYHSESETGHRNRAIGHLLRNFEIIGSDPMPVAELYFMQCSIAVTCRDLGLIAGTLANRGINPVTGRQAVRGEYVESILSVMGTCGMYDSAGEWLYDIGMPAKSGVGGGVIAVLPGQLGIGVFSPRLDRHGNSVRGVQACRELSRHLDLHLLNRPGSARSVVRLKASGAILNSNRVRTPNENQLLRAEGGRIGVWQLQGHLNFTTAEAALGDVFACPQTPDFVIVDLKRVLSVNECACGLFHEAQRSLAAQGRHLVFSHADRTPLLQRLLRLKLGARFAAEYRGFADLDLALEWCEDRLIAVALQGAGGVEAGEHPPAFAAFAGLDAAGLASVGPMLKHVHYTRGETIIRAGDEAREMFLLKRGRVSVMLPGAEGTVRRLATFSAGMTFGEMALLDRAPRSAMIVADTAVECAVLTREDFDRLGTTHPAVKIQLLENLCLDLCGKLRKANRELQLLD
jgi:glutaminase